MGHGCDSTTLEACGAVYMILRVGSKRAGHFFHSSAAGAERMADLEQHAFRRDKRFVVRLVVGLIVATLGGLFVSGQLTNQRNAGCAADALVDPRTERTAIPPK